MRCSSRSLRCPWACTSASPSALSLPPCTWAWRPWISFCSWSICCWRGRYLLSRSVCAFLSSAVCSSAACRLTTATFVWAEAATVPSTSAATKPARLIIAQHSQDFVLPQHQIVAVVDAHVGTGILAEENAIAGFHINVGALPVFQQLAGAHGHHFGLLWFLLRRIGDDDAAAH